MIAVFIPFQREAQYTSSTAGRVMLRVTSVMFGIVRECCRNFENKTNCHDRKIYGVGSARLGTVETFVI